MRAFMFLVVILCGATAVHAHAENVESLSKYVDTLEEHIASGRRFDPLLGNQSMIAWACAQDVRQSHGVRFEACCKEVDQLFYNHEHKLAFLDIARVNIAEVDELLAEHNESVEDFWAEFGPLPSSAAACANAMLDYRRAKGLVYVTEQAITALKKHCSPDSLWGDYHAELVRRGELEDGELK